MAQVQDQQTQGPLYTPPQVGALLGIDQRTVRDYIRTNKLPAIRIDGHWFISESDLQTFRSTYCPSSRKKRDTRRFNLRQVDLDTLSTLAQWDDGTAEELALALQLHPGNARKHLCILEAQEFVVRVAKRDSATVWRVTAKGIYCLSTLVGEQGLENSPQKRRNDYRTN